MSMFELTPGLALSQAKDNSASPLRRLEGNWDTLRVGLRKLFRDHHDPQDVEVLMRPGPSLIKRYPILKYVPFYAGYLET